MFEFTDLVVLSFCHVSFNLSYAVQPFFYFTILYKRNQRSDVTKDDLLFNLVKKQVLTLYRRFTFWIITVSSTKHTTLSSLFTSSIGCQTAWGMMKGSDYVIYFHLCRKWTFHLSMSSCLPLRIFQMPSLTFSDNTHCKVNSSHLSQEHLGANYVSQYIVLRKLCFSIWQPLFFVTLYFFFLRRWYWN